MQGKGSGGLSIHVEHYLEGNNLQFPNFDSFAARNLPNRPPTWKWRPFK